MAFAGEGIFIQTLLYEWWLNINNPHALQILEPQSQRFVNPVITEKTIALDCLLESEMALKSIVARSNPLVKQHSEDFHREIQELNWNT